MGFKEFKDRLQEHVSAMLCDPDVKQLFIVDVDKDLLWETYLESFPPEANGIFRKRREHDCGACRHFIKAFGNVVALKNGVLRTIWDFDTDASCEEYQPSVAALSKLVRSSPILDVFITKETAFGVDKNHEDVEGQILTWHHLYTTLPARFVYRGSETLDTEKAKIRDVRNVFKRGLDEITVEAMLAVLDLISAGSLYKGEENEALIKQFLAAKNHYIKLDDDKKGLFAWEQSVNLPPSLAAIRGHAIGTLLVDVSEGADLDAAVGKYEAMVAPSNYKRPKAIFTKRMLEDAKKKIEELGLMPSLGRRLATLDDITVNNILFANRDAAKRISGSVFDEMAGGLAVNPKSFDRAEEIGIEAFLRDVLPSASSVEALLENRHSPNLVSLIAPKVKDAPTMFKWGNGFSWAYSGNITDAMKERVKSMGGKVDGDLRFSIQWNDHKDNNDDLDAHCVEPGGIHIYFGQKAPAGTSGRLDVDIRVPDRETKDGVAVENITYPDRNRMLEGTYRFYVHQFSARGARSGFTAEIEFDGQIFSFSRDLPLRQNEDVPVASVIYSRRDGFKLVESLPSATSSRSTWGLQTSQLIPVSVIMYSPNYWDLQEGIGNKHYLFMLKGCVSEETPNGFFNEFLKEDLLVHKRVFEALGGEMRVESVPDQLSGVGFSSTKRSSLVVKVEGRVKRTLKIMF